MNLWVKKVFFLSRIIKEEGRSFSIGLVENENGKLLPRLFWRSNSGGGWRVSPYLVNGVFYKGKSYTGSTVLVNEFENLLLEMESKNEMGTSEQSVVRLFEFSLKDFEIMQPDYNKEEPEVVYVNSESQKKQPGSMFKTNDGYNSASELDNLGYPEGFVPDFSQKPVKTYRGKHTLLGEIIIEEFGAKLNGEDIIWAMARDNEGRVWVENIYFAKVEVNSYGNYRRIIAAGALSNKPLDYLSNVTNLSSIETLIDRNWFFENHYNDIEIDNFGDSRYYDITRVLDHLAPIKQYREKRGIIRVASNKIVSNYGAIMVLRDDNLLAVSSKSEIKVNRNNVQTINYHSSSFMILADGDVVEYSINKTKIFLIVKRRSDGLLLLVDNNSSKPFDITARAINLEDVEKGEQKQKAGDEFLAIMGNRINDYRDSMMALNLSKIFPDDYSVEDIKKIYYWMVENKQRYIFNDIKGSSTDEIVSWVVGQLEKLDIKINNQIALGIVEIFDNDLVLRIKRYVAVEKEVAAATNLNQLKAAIDGMNLIVMNGERVYQQDVEEKIEMLQKKKNVDINSFPEEYGIRKKIGELMLK